MANDITGNPWKLDTPGVITTSGVHIKNLIWTNGATGNTCVLLDNAGRDVARATYTAQGTVVFFEMKWVQGLNLTTLTGGELLLVVHK